MNGRVVFSVCRLMILRIVGYAASQSPRKIPVWTSWGSPSMMSATVRGLRQSRHPRHPKDVSLDTPWATPSAPPLRACTAINASNLPDQPTTWSIPAGPKGTGTQEDVIGITDNALLCSLASRQNEERFVMACSLCGGRKCHSVLRFAFISRVSKISAGRTFIESPKIAVC